MLKPLDLKSRPFKPLFEEKDPPLWAMEKYFYFYENELKPYIMENLQQPLDGMHGLNTHTNAVVFRGIDYALHIGKDPMPVVFVCTLHDAARKNDEWDTEHGRAAVPLAMRIIKKFPNLFDTATKMSIYSAILNHTTGVIAPDYISGCSWDADRTRLSWLYEFKEEFFTTQRAKYVAQHCKKYLDFQKRHFPEFNWSKEY